MRAMTTRLGELSCRVVEGGAGKPGLLVVLCHGFGAPGEDLVGLAPELVRLAPSLGSARFVFPEAPLSLGDMGWGDARAWWMIDLARHAATLGSEPSPSWRREIPEGLPQARRLLTAAVDVALRDAGLGYDRLVLGGFSQGAMLATDLALRLDEPPAALVALSGTLITEEEWTSRAPRRKGLRVLQSHGRQDPILTFRGAEALRDLLTGAGLQVEFVPFAGDHTIPPQALERLSALLAELVAR